MRTIIREKTGEKFYAVQRTNLLDYPQLKDRFYVRAEETDPNPKVVYLKAEDYLHYVQNLDLNPKQPQVLSLLNEALIGAQLLIEKEGLNVSSLKVYEKVSTCLSLLPKISLLDNLLNQLIQGDVKGAMLRTLLTKAIANNLGWSNAANLQKLFLGALLADLNPNPNTTSQQLEDLGLHRDIIQIVAHAKENKDGSGPLKIKGPYIYNLSKVVRVAQEISLMLLENKNPHQIKQGLENLSLEKLDKSIVKASLILWP